MAMSPMISVCCTVSYCAPRTLRRGRFFAALQNTATLFSDTKPDLSIQIRLGGQATSSASLLGYGFRSASNRAILAYWLPILSKAGDSSPAAKVTLQITNSGIHNPVLVDVTTGEMTPLSWKSGTADTLERVPLGDSVMAIADEEYFDWMELPEAPSELILASEQGHARLTWRVHGGDPEFVYIERRFGDRGRWRPLAKLPAGQTSFIDKQNPNEHEASSYR